MGANCASVKSLPVEVTIGLVDERKTTKKQAQAMSREYEAKMHFLGKVPLLQRLPKDQHPLVASVCESKVFKTKDTIIRQGDIGDEFFVIRTGEAGVFVKVDGVYRKVATLKSGDYFGENALLRDEPRSATIVAESEIKTFRITRSKFAELGLSDKLQFASRKAVSSGADALSKAKPPSPKTEAEVKLITDAIKNNEHLNPMSTVEDSKIQAFVDTMWKEHFVKGEIVISQGDLITDYFYIVQDGRFEICVAEEGEHAPKSGDKLARAHNQKTVNLVAKGGSFGELALLYMAPRAATVRAVTNGTCWVIDRGNFKDIMMKSSEAKIDEFVGHLENVPLLSALLANEKRELARALVDMIFLQGEPIVTQGLPGSTFFIMYEGTVDIVKDDMVMGHLEANPEKAVAQYFGEFALLENVKRAATIVATSAMVKCLVLDRESFEHLLGPLKDIIQYEKNNLTKERKKKKEQQVVSSAAALSASRDKVLRKDLRKIGLIGLGGFSKVELYEHARTGRTYALKSVSKGYLCNHNLQQTVLNEKSVIVMTNSRFIVTLFETYNTDEHLHFLLEAALGGELYATMNRKGLFGDNGITRYYSAGCTFVFEHLHERNILYRDLKPENIVLDDKGNMKVTDFGLAKFVIGQTYTTCGTPEYFAPEMINASGHTLSVDWWSLGIFMYELMAGSTPFESPYPMQVYAKIVRGINKVDFPTKVFDSELENLIKSLLKTDPRQRIAMRPGGIMNLKCHKYLQDFDWNGMRDFKLKPPYRPRVKDKRDISNFFPSEKEVPPSEAYDDPGDGWDRNFATSD
eukprot:TRINITY_DN61009_c0_g1_i1.p1 TRINITY_DN61009_c0_g1~~TRINITY_DN61009_c0_g1_i1.p1  ORF type:complete len:804 (-),score=187.43 TRINITY_DN61009_c0_g1_i1:144-2555(-)